MNNSPFTRIKRVILSLIMGRGIMALRQIALVPLMINAWGVDYYGSWLIISAIPSFMMMTNLGLGTSATVKIALEKAANNQMAAERIFSTVQWSVLLIGMCVVALVFFAVGLGYAPQKNQIENPAAIITLLVATLFLQMLSTPLVGWWTGCGRQANGNHALNILSLLNLCMTVLIVLSGGRALLLTGVIFGLTAAWYLVFLKLTSVSFNLEYCGWNMRLFSYGELKELLGKGLGYQLAPLWQAMYFQGSLLLAGALFDVKAVALLGSLRVLVRMCNQLIEIVSQGVSGEMQISFSRGEMESLGLTYGMAMVASLCIAVASCAGLMLLGPYFFGVWTSHVFDVPYSIWVFFSISLIPFSVWWVGGELQRSVHRPWYVNIVAVAASLLSVVAMWVFSGVGILAFAIGALVFEFTMCIFVPRNTAKLLGESFYETMNKSAHDSILYVKIAVFRRKIYPGRDYGDRDI